MNFKTPTYAERRAAIKTPEDLEKQLKLGKAQVSRIRKAIDKAQTMEEKARLTVELNTANEVVRQLRLNFFNIEDELTAASSAATITA